MNKPKNNSKNEADLVREAIRIGGVYLAKIEGKSFAESEPLSLKINKVYTRLVKDNLIQPLARGQESELNIKHKLALWMKRVLPKEHPLNKK